MAFHKRAKPVAKPKPPEKDRHYMTSKLVRADEYLWNWLKERKRRTGRAVNRQIVDLIKKAYNDETESKAKTTLPSSR